MFSSLSGVADKTFIIAFLVPTLVLLLVLAALFADQPVVQGTTAALTQADSLEKVFLAAGFVWFVALGLMLLNRPILQLLEGYYGPLAGNGRKQRLRTEYLATKQEFEALDAAWVAEGPQFPADRQARHRELEQRLATEYPPEAHLLPTRFGNAIRSFETYPGEMYGAESITFWPHLLAEASDAFIAAVDDARAQVDCLANLVLVSVIVAAVAVGRLVLSDGSFVQFDVEAARYTLVNSAEYLFVFVAILALVACRVFYGMAVKAALGWGLAVRAMFDSYLPALAGRLGCEATDSELTFAFWRAASRRLVLGRRITGEMWAALKPPTSRPADPYENV